jgi:hypothetical protein
MIGDNTIGTSSAGSIKRFAGRSVRTTRKASSPPSGTAIAVIPAARTIEVRKARAKSGSPKINA